MIATEDITYSDGSDAFQGVIAWDDEIQTTRPVVLVVHTFRGQSQFETNKARELAKLGYIGFAIDVYGEGKRAGSPEEAQQLMDELNNNRSLLLKRMQLSLQTAKDLKFADEHRVAAVGYCFGGKCVLDLARSGAEIQGAVTFHGVYDKPDLDHKQTIKPSVLILHGWDDPLGLPHQVLELAAELTSLQADWMINSYGHTGHAFTNPNAQSPEDGMFYQKRTNDRAWESMCRFLSEIFAQ